MVDFPSLPCVLPQIGTHETNRADADFNKYLCVGAVWRIDVPD